MDFKEYQDKASSTAQYPRTEGKFPAYPALGLAGEAGEVAEKVKKCFRDDGGVMTDERRQALKKELGDVMWYIAALCSELELTMEEVAQANIEKLFDRQERGVIAGSGDNR